MKAVTHQVHSYEEYQIMFEKIVKGYRSRKTVKQIAKELKIKESAVVNYALQLRKAGVNLPRASRIEASKGSSFKNALADFIVKQKVQKTPKKESAPYTLPLFGEPVRKLEVKSV